MKRGEGSYSSHASPGRHHTSWFRSLLTFTPSLAFVPAAPPSSSSAQTNRPAETRHMGGREQGKTLPLPVDFSSPFHREPYLVARASCT